MENVFDCAWFNFDLSGIHLEISEHSILGQQVYHICFSDQRKPLSITKNRTVHGEIWASLPNGRQNEAEEFGIAITEYLSKT